MAHVATHHGGAAFRMPLRQVAAHKGFQGRQWRARAIHRGDFFGVVAALQGHSLSKVTEVTRVTHPYKGVTCDRDRCDGGVQ